MKKREIITEAKRKSLLADREKAIVESFAKTFNKIKRLDEAYGMSFEDAKAEAKRISDEEGGVAQHVNQVGEDKFIVSDFFDADTTVASFGIGIDEMDFGDEDWELEDRKQQYNFNRNQPELSDLGQLTPDQEEMKKYISKYVDSELELNDEMTNYISKGYQGLSDYIKNALRSDMDFITYVEIKKDEEQYRRERGF